MTLYNIDEIDKKLLSALKKDSKQSVKQLAQFVGLSSTPVYERIKRLEFHGFIEGYTIKLNQKKLGLNLEVFSRITLKNHARDSIKTFESKMKELPEVRQVYHLSGSSDYMIHVLTENMEVYHQFLTTSLASIPDILNVESSFVLKSIK